MAITSITELKPAPDGNVTIPRNVWDATQQTVDDYNRLENEHLTLALKMSQRIAALDRKLAEVGAVADRCSQLLTVLAERVDGLAARETL